MKKYLSLFFVLAMMFSISAPMVRAEDEQGDQNSTRTEIEQKIDAIREAAKEKMDALRAQLKDEKDALRAKVEELRITGRERALERFDRAIKRMTDLKTMISGRLTTLKARGVDTAKAEASLAIADTKLNDAKNKIAEIHTLLAASLKELNLENKTKLRKLAQEIQGLIVDAHRALRDAVKSLKDAVKVKMDKEGKVKAENEQGENNNE